MEALSCVSPCPGHVPGQQVWALCPKLPVESRGGTCQPDQGWGGRGGTDPRGAGTGQDMRVGCSRNHPDFCRRCLLPGQHERLSWWTEAEKIREGSHQHLWHQDLPAANQELLGGGPRCSHPQGRGLSSWCSTSEANPIPWRALWFQQQLAKPRRPSAERSEVFVASSGTRSRRGEGKGSKLC